MRIAYFMGSLNIGGAETLALDISRNAGYHDLEPIIIHRRKGNIYNEFLKTKVPLFEMKARSKFDIRYVLRIRKILLEYNVEIIHANQIVDAFVAWLASRGIKVKIVMTLHGHYLNQNKVKYRFLRWFIKRLDAIVFVSSTQLENYGSRKLIPSGTYGKCHIIYNGIDYHKIESSVPVPVRKEVDIPEDALLLGTVGNFGPGRDQMTICRFLKLLDKEKVNYVFLFIGEKNTAESWRYDQCTNFVKRSKLEPKVYFLGSRKDVPGLLRQFDAFIYSSEHDTFGIAVAEAMAASIPVFVNDIPVMKELTENGKLGTIFKSKNEHDLLLHFKSFIKDKIPYIEKQKHALNAVRNKYSIKRQINALKILYTSL